MLLETYPCLMSLVHLDHATTLVPACCEPNLDFTPMLKLYITNAHAALYTHLAKPPRAICQRSRATPQKATNGGARMPSFIVCSDAPPPLPAPGARTHYFPCPHPFGAIGAVANAGLGGGGHA
jgi:hypothetical protein